MSTVGLVLLAAGASIRLGAPKQLVRHQGKTLLRRAAETAVASKCRPIVVVLGAHREACAAELKELPLRAVWNPHWEEGMGASLRVGLQALLANDAPSAVILMLCDQPLLTAKTLDGLVDAFHEGGNTLVASEYAGTAGVPALFSSALFPEMLALRGAERARSVIQRHRAAARLLPFPDGAMDIDTPDDYARLHEHSP